MDNACEACGWMAAVASMLAFGSFGVPIKSKVVTALDVDPLVFQSYKTLVCFLTSWLVLLLGQEFTFTPWGIVSGLFWVPGGVATVYAVKSAGLAVGIGVGSSFIVLVSFTWGIFVFEEGVKSKVGACFAVLLMILGIIGMSAFSSPEAPLQDYSLGQTDEHVEEDTDSQQSSRHSGASVADHESESGNPIIDQRYSRDRDEGEFRDEVQSTQSSENNPHDFQLCGRKLTKRTLGIMAAIFNGTWGGSIMVPMHWSGGIGYVISFGIGASVITILLWVLRYGFLLNKCRSLRKAFELLPSFHARQMWLQGGTSGLLWSIGNFFSMISVGDLGEGVGYSVIQAAMLISGLWGIFYFREITRLATIIKWFLSASLTVGGIVLLSYEHKV